jgi:TonB family protein
MRHPLSVKTSILLPLVMASAALVTPASANTFSGLYTVNRNVGSAPSPTPQDIRNNRQEVHYPLVSQMRNEEGTVGLKVSVTELGRVSDVVVENSSGYPRLDNAALEYVKAKWQYKPTEAGQPAPAAVWVNVTFDMP